MRSPLSPSLLLALTACAACAPPAALVPEPAAPAALRTFVLDDPPLIGESGGVRFVEGGMSGLDVLAGRGSDLVAVRFLAVSDRGPNADAERAPRAAGRPVKVFPFPDYQPGLFVLRVDGERLVVDDVRRLTRPDGRPVRGLPPPAGAGADVLEEAWADTAGTALPRDPWGIDAEGVSVGHDGAVWVADEYRPSLWEVDAATGRVRHRYTPVPSDAADRPLPRVLTRRGPNLGFEGVTVLPSGRVVAGLQGPLALDGAAGSPLARLLVLDPATGAASFVAFALDGPRRMLSDVAALDDGRLLMVEHGPGADGRWSAHVYRLDLGAASAVDEAAPPERFASADAATAAGVRLAPKTLVLDLLASGWPAAFEKPEGLAILDDRTLAILNDNDYGLDDSASDGTFTPTGLRPTLHVFTLPRPLTSD